MPVEPEFWQPKEAARHLNIHVRTLYDWVTPSEKSNKVRKPVLLGPKPPFYKFGRKCIRFPVKEFREWTKRFLVNQKGK